MEVTDQLSAHKPADQLAALWEDLRAGRVPSDDVRAWFCAGVAASVRRAEALDVSLGLSVAGHPSLHAQLQRLARDHFLLEALASVAMDEVTDWARCRRLAGLAHAFMNYTWRIHRTKSEPSGDWATWQRALFRAAQTGQKVPTTPRGLWDILKKYSPFSLQRRPATVLLPLLQIDHASNRQNADPADLR